MEMTLEALRGVMRACAGEDEQVDLDGEILDISFSDLGYDSLAVIEISSRVRLLSTKPMAEIDLDEISTPREFLAVVNG